METINIESNLLEQKISASSTSLQTQNYGLDTDLSVDNIQSSTQDSQVLFIDSAVEDYQSLIDNLSQPTDVVVLDSQRDGIFQITNYLSQYDDLNAVHIVSHGSAGQLFLGNTKLNQDTLPHSIQTY